MKLRSILGAFLFIILASFIGLFFFVQTKSFGALLTKVVTDLSQRKANAKVTVKNVEISFFPPGLELNKVTFTRNHPEDKISAEIGQLGFYLNLIEIEERRLSFGEIRIQDSVIVVDSPSEEDSQEEIEQKLIDKIFSLSEKAPVRIDTLIVENAHLHINYDLMEVRRLKIFKKSKEFIGRFHLANIKPSQESELVLDEVWGDIEIGRKKLEIYRLKVLHDVQTVMVKGVIQNYRLLKGATAELKGEASIHLKELDQLLGISNTIRMERGFADLSFNVNYLNRSLSGSSIVRINDLRSNLAYADIIDAKLEFSPGEVHLLKAELNRGRQHAHLLQPALIYDLEKKLILPAPLNLSFKNYTLTNALRVVPDLEPIHGLMTGIMTLRHDRGDFYIRPHDGYILNDVSLIVGEEKPSRILRIKSARLKEADISVVDKEVRISAFVQLPNSKAEVDGFVNKKMIRFSIVDAPFDLEDLGNVANLDIKGKGPLSLDVTGAGKNVQLNLKGKMQDFEVLGYKLGNADTNITVDLGEENVVIHRLESKYGSTPISVTGAVNYDNLDIALGINSPSTNYYELSQILSPIFTKLDFLPEDFNFNAKVDANVYGKTKFPELKAKSNVQFTDLTAFGETINSGSVNINLADEVVHLQNLAGSKGRGTILGDFKFNSAKEFLQTNLRWEDLALSSFNFSKLLHLNVDGQIAGSLIGEGKSDDYALHLKSQMIGTRTQGYQFENSAVDMMIYPERLAGKFNFLGSILTSQFDVSLNQTEKSEFKANFTVPEIKPILLALLGQHIESEDITGKIYADIESRFTGKFNNFSLTGQLRDVAFLHPDFRMAYQSASPDFIIRDNVIEKWNLNINDPDILIKSEGDGVFGERVSLIQTAHFSSKLLEILVGPILSAEGFIRTAMKISGNDDEYEMSLSSKVSGVNMTIQDVPFPLNDLSYDLDYADRRLQIHHVRSILESGSVALNGEVYFDPEDAPDVNVKYVLDRAEIPVLGRSSINVTGEGIILGNELPYSLTGDLILNKALIVNELNEFNSRSNAFSQIRYLPKNQSSILGKLLNLNVNVKADNPIRVNNSMMDVSLRGEVRLYGNPSRPRGEGRLFAPVNSSRIYFKNNEYTITSADINFFAKKDITNPDFDIQAVTNMSNYKVYAKAYGDLERFNFDLTSDPALPRNSILSLIAFGYTDEIGTLSPEDQQSLTQMGVGSFVLDRFKISDILNKQFGVQVNVGTIFEQSEQSLLAGRTQDSGFGPGVRDHLGRTRSATKIELIKRLDEATALSVSSTMGGQIGTRQSMNLTYNISRKVQLEGVYELRTAAEAEEDSINDSNSIGGDINFRWSFK